MPINDFDVMSGTSMAAPIVAGTIALLKSVNRDVTISQAIDILTQSGMALSDSSLGPLVQADRALILLRDGSLPPAGRDDRPVEQPADQPEESVADYSDIFRQISEHQRAISDLVDMLPPDERAQFR
jgi:subtilisin family serine protease